MESNFFENLKCAGWRIVWAKNLPIFFFEIQLKFKKLGNFM
jgi:hypothetical protein